MSAKATAERDAALDRFRVAMKFTLWTWALYWPGGGILLLTGGLDPISIGVVVLSFGAFAYLMLSGVMSSKHSKNMKEFFLERPLYLIGALVVLALLTPLVTQLATVGLLLFSTTYLAAMVLAGVRLVEYYKMQEKPFLQSGVDQVFIALGIGTFTAFLIFVDSWLFLLTGAAISGPPATVALANWLSLLFPAMILLATRGIRDPLQKPQLKLRRNKDADVAKTPVAAQSEA